MRMNFNFLKERFFYLGLMLGACIFLYQDNIDLGDSNKGRSNAPSRKSEVIAHAVLNRLQPGVGLMLAAKDIFPMDSDKSASSDEVSPSEIPVVYVSRLLSISRIDGEFMAYLLVHDGQNEKAELHKRGDIIGDEVVDKIDYNSITFNKGEAHRQLMMFSSDISVKN